MNHYFTYMCPESPLVTLLWLPGLSGWNLCSCLAVPAVVVAVGVVVVEVVVAWDLSGWDWFVVDFAGKYVIVGRSGRTENA